MDGLMEGGWQCFIIGGGIAFCMYCRMSKLRRMGSTKGSRVLFLVATGQRDVLVVDCAPHVFSDR